MAAGTALAMRIEDAGYLGRTPRVLQRERALWGQMAGELASGPRDDNVVLSSAEPMQGSGPPTLTLEQLETGFTSGATQLLQPAAFIAGRCDVDGAADERLDGWLREFVGGCDESDLGARAVPYVEAAMSLVLRGHEEGVALLRALVADDAGGTMADWLAAYYLAQLGDASAWPAMLGQLEADDGFTRLMAARHLIGFLPFDGQTIDGETIDVRRRLGAMRKDDDELVAQEIPGLLAEAGE